MLDEFAVKSCNVINLIDEAQKEIITSNVNNPTCALLTSPDVIIRYLHVFVTRIGAY